MISGHLQPGYVQDYRQAASLSSRPPFPPHWTWIAALPGRVAKASGPSEGRNGGVASVGLSGSGAGEALPRFLVAPHC